MSYTNTLILVAEDCPVREGVAPAARGEAKSIPMIQYELIRGHPYRYTHEDLLFEVHVRHKGLESDVKARGAAIRAELFSRSHPCLRASPLPKRYGWGVHYDEAGRIAIYGMESDDYRRLSQGGGVALVPAMRNRRA